MTTIFEYFDNENNTFIKINFDKKQSRYVKCSSV